MIHPKDLTRIKVFWFIFGLAFGALAFAFLEDRFGLFKKPQTATIEYGDPNMRLVQSESEARILWLQHKIDSLLQEEPRLPDTQIVPNNKLDNQPWKKIPTP